MIKLAWMTLLLIKEAQTIPGVTNQRDSLHFYFPECELSSINPLGDKGMYWGEKRLLYSNIFWQHKVKQRETDVFIAALFLEPFMGILALLFSKEYHCPQGFQTYFTLKSLHVKYLMRLNFPGTFFGKCRYRPILGFYSWGDLEGENNIPQSTQRMS